MKQYERQDNRGIKTTVSGDARHNPMNNTQNNHTNRNVSDTQKEAFKENLEQAGEKKSKLDYEVTVTLPSRGIPYEGTGIPAEVSLRGMTTRDEKILYASQGGDVFKKILRNCIVSPKNIDINKLIAQDEMFLILQLRMVTYGDDYKVTIPCPHCGNKDTYTIKLSSFETKYLDESFREPIMIELPRSGDILECKLLRNEDNEFVEKYARKRAKQFNLNYREEEYTCRLARYIVSVNGEKLDFTDTREYVENMQAMDSRKLLTVFESLEVGVDPVASATCSACGEDFDFSVPITSEFFRPKIK